MKTRRALRIGGVMVLVALCVPALAVAQAPASPSVAKELAAALDAKKRDAIAAKIPGDSNRYVAALYFPGVQLLVIAGAYAAPALLDQKIAQQQYRDAYLDLSGTLPNDSRIFVMDMGGPGLASKKTDGFFDTWTQGGKQVVFDGSWDAQKISESEYAKLFAAADAEYTKILGALLTEAKK